MVNLFPIHDGSFVDTMGMGSWFLGRFSLGKRGPCPFTDWAEFRHHIEEHSQSALFQKSKIGELLLDQKYFNGNEQILARLK